MKKIYLYTLAGAFGLLGAGCNKVKDFGNVNTDPSRTVTAIPSALLSNVESNLGSYASTGTEANSGGQYAQFFTETQYSGTSLYNLPQNDFSGRYTGDLNNLQIIINQNPNKNMVNVAKILQQYIFWVITDSWGDVPYSEALKGIANIQPKYDSQQDIYKGILTNLTAAINSFDASAISGDLVYGGDVASWKRMANSLKLLVAIQMSKTSESATASAAAKEAVAAGVITTTTQNFTLTYPGGNFKSPWWNLYNGRKDFAESKTLTDYTLATNDPRQAPFGGESEVAGNVTTSNIGVPYGLARLSVIAFTDANPKWARVLRGDFRLEAGSVTLITASEIWLARAEGVNLGWLSEDVATDFRTGLTESYTQWKVSGNAATAFTNLLSYYHITTGIPSIEMISTQRWVASYPDGHQAWDIWRKSNYPTLAPAPDAVNSSKQIVRRFVYATTEYNTNGKNVTAAVARMGGDTQDTRVWWDGGK